VDWNSDSDAEDSDLDLNSSRKDSDLLDLATSQIPKAHKGNLYNVCSGLWLGLGSDLDPKVHFQNNEPSEHQPITK